MTKTKWFIYTVLPGLTPVAMRLLITLLAANPSFGNSIQATDIIAFGLIILIANIAVLEHEERVPSHWKTKHIGLSLFLVMLFAVLFAAASFEGLNPGVFVAWKITLASAVLSIAALGFSYAIWDRLAGLRQAQGQGT